MTVESCYQQMGGSYEEIHARFASDALVKKFLNIFLRDPSYGALCSAMDAGDRAEAFQAAHTLKGVCANLNLERLRGAASELTEVLRPEADVIPAAAFPLLDRVKAEYQTTIDAISAFFAEE